MFLGTIASFVQKNLILTEIFRSYILAVQNAAFLHLITCLKAFCMSPILAFRKLGELPDVQLHYNKIIKRKYCYVIEWMWGEWISMQLNTDNVILFFMVWNHFFRSCSSFFSILKITGCSAAVQLPCLFELLKSVFQTLHEPNMQKIFYSQSLDLYDWKGNCYKCL